MIKKIFTVILVILVLSSAGSVGAQSALHSKEEPVNNICPVMGLPVSKDTPYRVEYEGVVIGFSSPGCPEAFIANPERYYKNIEKGFVEGILSIL